MNCRIGFLGALIVLSTFVSKAQIGLKPLNTNPQIISYLQENPNYQWNQPKSHAKWGSRDTLALPFFEDFTINSMYPDSSKWVDNFVFVNRSFPINPPSYGVATFDYLDETGRPYNSLEDESLEYGDTLTSQPINLAKDTNGVAYTIADSIALSFFYQEKGLGDLITEDDSLKMLFLDKDGNWVQVWEVRGTGNTSFKQVLVMLEDVRFLHEAFQFRFVNFTHRWGNNNHWHLDHVYLNSGRGVADLFYDDYAIGSMPTSLLKHYAAMPYSHFMADVSEAADSIYFGLANNEDIAVQLEVRHKELHDTNILIETNFGGVNAINVESRVNGTGKIKSYDFTGRTGYPVIIERQYYTSKPSVTNPVLFQSNDVLITNQEFRRYFAYDDGTPESGFGFNDLRNNEGRIVLRFDLKKQDTLRAVDFSMTYNTQDVSRQRFTLEIYKDIDFNGGQDELVYQASYIGQDVYDLMSDRGFYTIPLDSAIVLDQGSFYVGWSQERDFNLSVGFDKNNGNLVDTTYNQNIFFNIGDGWVQNSNTKLIGAPMIRPVIGEKNPFVSIPRIVKDQEPVNVIYPNPASDKLYFKQPVSQVVISNMQGRQVIIESPTASGIDISHLPAGIYIVTCTLKNDKLAVERFIKN